MIVRLHPLIFFTLTLSFFGCSPEKTTSQNGEAAQATSRNLSSIDSLMQARHESGRFDGSVVIARREEVIYHKEFGLADRSWSVPVTSDTRFDIASLNKSFTGALFLIAEQEGRLSVDDKLVDHLRAFSWSGNFHPDITLHQILTHTSGLPDYDGANQELSANGFRKLKRMHVTNAEYVDFISRLDPVALPGETFHYSNFAYHLLNIVLEEVFGAPYSDILQEKICGPLNMDHTLSVTDNEEIIARLARGYNWDEAAGKWKENDYIDLTLGRRIFSTAGDLMKWAQAMNDDRLLPDSLRQKMLTNHLDGPVSYGYGMVIFDGRGEYAMGDLETERKYIIHGGNTGGYRSLLVNAEEGEIMITFLSNVGERTDELELAKLLLRYTDQ